MIHCMYIFLPWQISGPPESPSHSPFPSSCCKQIILVLSRFVRPGHALADIDENTLSLCNMVLCRPGGTSISPQPIAMHATYSFIGNPLSDIRTTFTAAVITNGLTRIRAKSSLATRFTLMRSRK